MYHGYLYQIIRANMDILMDIHVKPRISTRISTLTRQRESFDLGSYKNLPFVEPLRHLPPPILKSSVKSHIGRFHPEDLVSPQYRCPKLRQHETICCTPNILQKQHIIRNYKPYLYGRACLHFRRKTYFSVTLDLCPWKSHLSTDE